MSQRFSQLAILMLITACAFAITVASANAFHRASVTSSDAAVLFNMPDSVMTPLAPGYALAPSAPLPKAKSPRNYCQLVVEIQGQQRLVDLCQPPSQASPDPLDPDIISPSTHYAYTPYAAPVARPNIHRFSL